MVSRVDDAGRLAYGGKRHLERNGDRLMILGDILPDWVFHEVLSFGDLVMSVGIAAVFANLLNPDRRPRRWGTPRAANSGPAHWPPASGRARHPARPPPATRLD